MEWETNDELIKNIALRFKAIRKTKRVSQKQLALMSEVSYGSIKRFEATGEISLHSLAKLCQALEIKQDLRNLFTEVKFANLDEALRYGK